MANDSPSLLQYLSTENPTLDVKCKGGSNTRSGKISWDIPRRVQDWADFEYQSLDSIYNGALRNVLRRQSGLEQQKWPDLQRREIYCEENMTHIVVLWNQTRVSDGLEAAQERFGADLPHEKICMSQGKQAQPPMKVSRLISSESNGNKQYRKYSRDPDWAGRKPSTVNPNEPRTKAKNILPGDTKMSPKWQSFRLPEGDVTTDMVNRNWFQPVGQIYTYCVRLNARYGYIITDQELVVFRVRPLPWTDELREEERIEKARNKLDELLELDPTSTASAQELEDYVEGAPEATRALTSGLLEYKAIPWNSHIQDSQSRSRRGPKVMTVNLALWWLHMMAAESSAIEENYVPLAEAVWDTDPRNKTPAYAVGETGSQETAPSHKTSSNSGRRLTSFESDRGGRKRTTKSRSYVTSFESDTGEKKRTRDDDDDAEMPMANPARRLTRGRK